MKNQSKKPNHHRAPVSRDADGATDTGLTVLITSLRADGDGRTDITHARVLSLVDAADMRTELLIRIAERHRATVPSMAGRIVVEVAAYEGVFDPGAISSPTELRRVKESHGDRHWQTLGRLPEVLIVNPSPNATIALHDDGRILVVPQPVSVNDEYTATSTVHRLGRGGVS